MHNAQTLLQKIEALPPARIAEVENFVDFMVDKASRQAAIIRLLDVAPALEAAGIPPMTEDEIQTEIDALRVSRQPVVSSADRS